MGFDGVIEIIGMAIDGVGVAVIVVGSGTAIVMAIAQLRRGADGVYQFLRRRIGRTILLGLELLVAGDIVRTVATQPTLLSVAVLGAIVLIRTFLSFSLEMEVTGRWPWQKRGTPTEPS